MDQDATNCPNCASAERYVSLRTLKGNAGFDKVVDEATVDQFSDRLLGFGPFDKLPLFRLFRIMRGQTRLPSVKGFLDALLETGLEPNPLHRFLPAPST
ncbi:hypothetical protein [Methylocella silvestris]|uniref:hypothetical protein n=1 Tax=Methylocella silvestris TaxID=199596 RepID=UPI0011AF781C|nr:hypothetical protein [Methylocella silvestris]